MHINDVFAKNSKMRRKKQDWKQFDGQGGWTCGPTRDRSNRANECEKKEISKSILPRGKPSEMTEAVETAEDDDDVEDAEDAA